MRKLATSLAGHTADPAAWAEALALIGPSAHPDDIPDDVLARATVYARSPEPRHRRQALKILERAFADRINTPDSLAIGDKMIRLLLDLNQPEEGLKQANEALLRIGRQPNLLDTRGVIEIRLGRLDDAIKDLEEAAEALPTGPVYFHLARAFQKKGRMADFRACRDRARQAGIRPEQLEESEKNDWNLIMRD